MISFARSGNSPESIGAIALADQIVDHIYHLILTCNPNGELAKRKGRKHLSTLYAHKGQ